ncbi:Dapdiamide synthesis protein DdaC [Durusdinium trenchii]|uniref:Dapdiamide synthesis protein DdaC n=1 Tax=Durusdinium trenchii TaxID=1381693 RepID=A0ABP0LM79_9DINO
MYKLCCLRLSFPSRGFRLAFRAYGSTEEIAQKGYTVASLGAAASVRDMEIVALRLMGVSPNSTGSYNGRGGVVRSSIDGTGFVDSAAGAPKELPVQFHNEMAYALEYPKYVTFAMVKQAQEDGTTTLADNVAVHRSLSEPLLEKFRQLGVQYIRYLHDESERNLAPDFYNSWQGAFQTASMDEAFQKGNDKASFSILQRHDQRRLRHVLWCPVFHKHPTYGELFFNSVLNRHGSWLDGHEIFDQMPNHERPYHCTWGDGSDFQDDELAEIRRVYEENTEYIRLDPGDVLVLDNLRVVHGRTSYKGSRLLGLLLSDMVPREPCKPPAAFARLLHE